MSGLTRWLPRLIVALGVVHLGYAVLESPQLIAEMIDDGVVGAADRRERDYVVWFLIGGLTLFMIGSMMRWSIRATGRIPAHLGWWIVGIGVFDTVLEPGGGGWLLLLLGGLAVYASRLPATPATVGR